MKGLILERVLLVAVALLLLLGPVGCNLLDLFGFNGSGIEVLQSSKPRETSPQVDQHELEELVTGNSAFALDLYAALRGEGGNLFYSPYSISLALAMTYAGARGETERQMGATLHFTLSQDRLHPAFNALDLALASRGRAVSEGFRLNRANSLWGQLGYPFLESFLDTLAENYGAGLRLLDFQNRPEESRLVINDWVSDQTAGRIQDLLPEGSIGSDTRLVLTNAIYFKAAWKNPFNESLTQPGPFHLLDGSQATVPLMRQTATFGYAAGPGYQAVELPYDGDELSMVVLLPEEGRFEEFEGSLEPDRLSAILNELQPQSVELTMPKFRYTSSFSLRDTLAAMGMPIAFSELADFSGMNGTGGLAISDVIHKAFVAVDEAGTEAAAATAVVIRETAVLPSIEVRLDRPFIFLIRDIPSGSILFIGRVLNPPL
ncbi:MAG: serpin family protein [Candidatus Acetothermia bacterium]|jgi:serpin B|nr:serpin family protein [Candidatus Acetothermia bacterium]MDH7505346.1 serpin family protein [Candidatus Acetothermia bacterium]